MTADEVAKACKGPWFPLEYMQTTGSPPPNPSNLGWAGVWVLRSTHENELGLTVGVWERVE